jgi:serine/threonine protein phosphatase PrpC
MPRTVEIAQEPEFFLEADMPDSELRRVGPGLVAVQTQRRPNSGSANEDGVALIPCDAERCVLAVADGVGGHPEGATAARLALTALAQSATQATVDGAELRNGILDGFEQANQSVTALGVGAATTMAVAEIADGAVRTYHVGDSAALVVGQRGKIRLRTVSHSPVGYAVEGGWIGESEAMHHEVRHLVSNVVGSEGMRIDIGSALTLRPYDTLLLGSDGLFDNLQVEEITQLIRKGPLPRVIQSLVSACRSRMEAAPAGEPSNPDDLTAVVYRFRGAAD